MANEKSMAPLHSAPIAEGSVERSQPSLLARGGAPSGSVPGTLAPPLDALPARIRVIAFVVDSAEETNIADPTELEKNLPAKRVKRSDITGFGEGSGRVIATIAAALLIGFRRCGWLRG